MKVLTIAGVGPGDPSLLTLAAVDAIQESTVVSYPVSRRGGDSLAEKIASKWSIIFFPTWTRLVFLCSMMDCLMVSLCASYILFGSKSA